MSAPYIQLTGGSTTLLSLATTDILSTYTFTPSLYCTAGDQTIFVTVVKNATIGTVTVKCQISFDDSNFIDVISVKSDVGTNAVEHATAVAAAATYRFAYLCTEATRAVSMRVGVKADVQGGAGESIAVTGTVM